MYYGTDTRLFDLMAGAAIAFVAASRPQPGSRAQRTLHVAGPLAGAALAVFWVTAGTAAGLPKDYMFRGGFLVCAVLAAVVVADARLIGPGRFSRLLAVRPVHFVGTISYGVYLWHWPVIVYLTAVRTGLSPVPLDLVRVGVTLALSTASYYLVERPIRRARLRGWVRTWVAPIAGVTTAVVIVFATVPSVADPGQVATTARVANHPGSTVPGAGGYRGQQPIRLAAPPSPTNPLRVTILGDSVMHDASFGIRAGLAATGEGVLSIDTVDGFGLTTSTDWPQVFPEVIRLNRPQLIVAGWSWDDYGPTTPNALHQPVRYARLLHRAVATLLAPGNGVEGVIFMQFPKVGNVSNADNQPHPTSRTRALGVVAWNRIAESMTRQFPGRVMFLPLGGSLLWHGKYSAWLPAGNDPHVPLDQWIRVRKLDRVHLCAEGAARYADALLTDMTALFKLAPPDPAWIQGSWTGYSDYNNPPGSCPDDHPPSG